MVIDLRDVFESGGSFIALNQPPYIVPLDLDVARSIWLDYPVFVESSGGDIEASSPVLFSIRNGSLSKVYVASRNRLDKFRGGILSRFLLRRAMDRGLPGSVESIRIRLDIGLRLYEAVEFLSPIYIDPNTLFTLLEQGWRLYVRGFDYTRRLYKLVTKYSLTVDTILSSFTGEDIELRGFGKRLIVGEDGRISFNLLHQSHFDYGNRMLILRGRKDLITVD